MITGIIIISIGTFGIGFLLGKYFQNQSKEEPSVHERLGLLPPFFVQKPYISDINFDDYSKEGLGSNGKQWGRNEKTLKLKPGVYQVLGLRFKKNTTCDITTLGGFDTKDYHKIITLLNTDKLD